MDIYILVLLSDFLLLSVLYIPRGSLWKTLVYFPIKLNWLAWLGLKGCYPPLNFFFHQYSEQGPKPQIKKLKNKNSKPTVQSKLKNKKTGNPLYIPILVLLSRLKIILPRQRGFNHPRKKALLHRLKKATCLLRKKVL